MLTHIKNDKNFSQTFIHQITVGGNLGSVKFLVLWFLILWRLILWRLFWIYVFQQKPCWRSVSWKKQRYCFSFENIFPGFRRIQYQGVEWQKHWTGQCPINLEIHFEISSKFLVERLGGAAPALVSATSLLWYSFTCDSSSDRYGGLNISLNESKKYIAYILY